jgi:hypothetical protein
MFKTQNNRQIRSFIYLNLYVFGELTGTENKKHFDSHYWCKLETVQSNLKNAVRKQGRNAITIWHCIGWWTKGHVWRPAYVCQLQAASCWQVCLYPGALHLTPSSALWSRRRARNILQSHDTSSPDIWARRSVVVEALCYKLAGRGFETRRSELIFSSYLILPAALGPGVYSAFNRNEYQKQKNYVSGEQSAAVA